MTRENAAARFAGANDFVAVALKDTGAAGGDGMAIAWEGTRKTVPEEKALFSEGAIAVWEAVRGRLEGRPIPIKVRWCLFARACLFPPAPPLPACSPSSLVLLLADAAASTAQRGLSVPPGATSRGRRLSHQGPGRWTRGRDAATLPEGNAMLERRGTACRQWRFPGTALLPKNKTWSCLVAQWCCLWRQK